MITTAEALGMFLSCLIVIFCVSQARYCRQVGQCLWEGLFLVLATILLVATLLYGFCFHVL